MRKAALFTAMSLDGYIAGRDGNVDWLHGHRSDDEEDMSSYDEFIKDMDTVVMGWKTYNQIVTELSPEKWMYEDLKSYVITHKALPKKENIIFVNENICDFINELKQEDGKQIWICGGASIIQPLIRDRLIDKIHISVIPTILGDGIRLFEITDQEIKLKLMHTRSYNGITDLVYELR